MFDLSSLGWDAAWAAASRTPDAHGRLGRVVRADGGVYLVCCAEGVVRASLAGTGLVAAARDLTRLPCVGDWVLVRDWPDRRFTVETVLPRRTAIVCGRPLAANLDMAAVVEPVSAHPGGLRSGLGRITRLLALARDSGARPLVILSRCDLVPEPAVLAARFAAVTGEEVLAVSARRGDGIDALRARVPAGQTLALLGFPGAGRSTLVGALAGATLLTTAGLVPVPAGGAVLDTPLDLALPGSGPPRHAAKWFGRMFG